MKNHKKQSALINIEFVIAFGYIIIWLVIYALSYFKLRAYNEILWEKVLSEWILTTALMILFFLNAYLFVPQLIFSKKYISYIILTLTITTSIIGSAVWLQQDFKTRNPSQMPPMEIGPGQPPMELSQSMPAPMGYKSADQSIPKSPLLIFIDYLIIGLLVVAAGSTLRILTRWLKEEERRKDIEKIQLRTELELLRHQVNPHFLMNTLNNIHALVDIDIEKSKDAIIRLSTLMRYLLYDSSKGKTSLLKELDFIDSYIMLMQLRYSEKVEIRTEIQENLPDTQIPSMLFISFIENAFKHGVSYRQNSFVHFLIEKKANWLLCTVLNSKHEKPAKEKNPYSGIGMNNVKRSLELLYQDNYTLNINETNTTFEVTLSIPIG
jgi:uncharacterized membrane protein